MFLKHTTSAPSKSESASLPTCCYVARRERTSTSAPAGWLAGLPAELTLMLTLRARGDACPCPFPPEWSRPRGGKTAARSPHDTAKLCWPRVFVTGAFKQVVPLLASISNAGPQTVRSVRVTEREHAGRRTLTTARSLPGKTSLMWTEKTTRVSRVAL